MRLVRWIEGAAEQTDAKAGSVRGEDGANGRRRTVARAHGLVCPEPRTRYLKLVS